MIDPARSRALATRLRADAIRCTTAAGSGHPTSSLSLADLLAVLALGHLRYDFARPQALGNDRLVLSKGHACPALYALYKAVGAIDDLELLSLRRFGSRLQGHPTPELPYVTSATGSLGQGLPFGVGLAYAGKHLDGLPHRTWVILGDGELAEGSNYEAAWAAAHFKLDNLIALVDVNRLGQRGPTIPQWDTGAYSRRFAGFGWRVIEVDGHDHGAIDQALGDAAEEHGAPTCVLARTVKGQGVSFLADAPGWHGKALSASEAEQALDELDPPAAEVIEVAAPPFCSIPPEQRNEAGGPWPGHAALGAGSPREAFGTTLAILGRQRSDLLVLDAEVANSTRSDLFGKEFPGRFLELQIAEQLLVSVAQGLAWGGRRVVFAATFAAFLTRAHDQLRMAAVSGADLRLAGSHAGIEIGEDGPSQMGLEDIALMRGLHGSTVLYPSDSVSTAHLVRAMVDCRGISYLRLTRGNLPALYPPDTAFPIGGSKVLRSSEHDQATLVAAGATLHQALAAARTLAAEGVAVRVIDAYSVKPLDELTIQRAARETPHVVVVEDHGPVGGLGEAVLSALAHGGRCDVRVTHLAVRGMPRSGTRDELYERFGLSAARIIAAVRNPADAPVVAEVAGSGQLR